MINTNITVIVFDFGGVLLSNDDIQEIGKYLAEKYHANEEALSKIILEEWFKARIDSKQDSSFWKNVSDKLNISPKELSDEFIAFPQPLPEAIKLVHDLEPNYRLAMLSNQILSWHIPLMKKHDLENIFSPIITSYEEHVAKPNEGIYLNLLTKLSVDPSQCIFIDDRDYNLTPAKNIGMQTLLFSTPTKLKDDLRALGIKF